MQDYMEKMAERLAESGMLGSLEPEKLAKKLAKTVSDDTGDDCVVSEENGRAASMDFTTNQKRPLTLSFEVEPEHTSKAEWRTKIQLTIAVQPELTEKEDGLFPMKGGGKLYDVLFDFRDDMTINEVADAIVQVVNSYIADW